MIQCQFCDEFEKGFLEFQDINFGNRILVESDNFAVFPSLGQIVEGYLLIASKEHHIGIGNVPQEQYRELDSVCQGVRRMLSDSYGSPLFFEHGSASERKKGGCCITHAHIHAVPVQCDILPELGSYFSYSEIESFDPLKEQFDKGVPYFFYESNAGKRYLFEIPDIVPSQYIRQVIALKIGKPERWDWRTCPGIDELLHTVELLKKPSIPKEHMGVVEQKMIKKFI